MNGIEDPKYLHQEQKNGKPVKINFSFSRQLRHQLDVSLGNTPFVVGTVAAIIVGLAISDDPQIREKTINIGLYGASLMYFADELLNWNRSGRNI